jgi:hypothetical protein
MLSAVNSEHSEAVTEKDEVALEILKTLKNAESKAVRTGKDNMRNIEVYNESGQKRSPNCSLKISQTAVYEFKKLKFENYLSRAISTDQTKDSIINMFAQFVTYVKENRRTKYPPTSDTRKIMFWVIDSQRNIFSEYLDSLTGKACSRRARIEAVIHAVSFLDSIHSDSSHHAFGDALRVLDTLRRQTCKSIKIESRSPERSVQHLISVNAYPKRGLKQIREHLDDGFEYFDALVGAAQAGMILSETRYLECLRYVLSTLWGYDDNARGLAIEKMCLDDVTLSLEHHDFVLSQHFKTYGHYEYQVVRFSGIIRNIWIPIIRAQVASKTNCERVFLSYSGKPLSQNDAGRHVQKYFRRYGLIITVTVLRKVLEASYREAEAAEVISAQEHSSLTLAQGHTELTAKEYYDIAGKASADSIIKAIDNTESFAKLCDALDVPDDYYERDGIYTSQSRVSAKVSDIMTRQPRYEGVLDESAFGTTYTGKVSNNGTRCEWTAEEIDWMEKWFISQPLDIPNRYSACLQALYEAPAHVKGMFHPHHVKNSDRLKSGAIKAERSIGRKNCYN